MAKANRNRDAGKEKYREALESWALRKLRRLRKLLLEELERLPRPARPEEEPHLCCLRPKNRMRISPLEAVAILEAFRRVPRLRAEFPRVLSRLRESLRGLKPTTERQPFDCPLLEGKRCLVHWVAKPIGCLAWNEGREYSPAAWRAFAERDALNDRVYGGRWKLRVIPLWLARLLGAQIRLRARIGNRRRRRGLRSHPAPDDAKHS